MKDRPAVGEAYSIVALDRFIQATRDSGYKSTSSAISELVDNAIQARASRIWITISQDEKKTHDGYVVTVRDNGTGMDPFTLRQALRFGGSTRFGDRNGLGRYGMGLPNASLSQARRVTVYTWQRGSCCSRARQKNKQIKVYSSYLDVDEIASGSVTDVPKPKIIRTPPVFCGGPTGTAVVWSRCDRLDNRRISTLVRKIDTELARRFRHYLWQGIRISINGESVRAADPLLLHKESKFSGARLFGDEMQFEILVDPTDPKRSSIVRVKFSELPIAAWHKLPNETKRKIGITKGAGVSIVRAGREVDFGWFFMGSKHRENYDDWWRCEVQFDPELDEAFGISHTKQQIRPMHHLLEALTPEIEATARALSSRVRKTHQEIKLHALNEVAEDIASSVDKILTPLPRKLEAEAKALYAVLSGKDLGLGFGGMGQQKYSIVTASVKATSFYSYARSGTHLICVLNPDHPFFRDVYRPLQESELDSDTRLRVKLELLLLAAARAEAASPGPIALSAFRQAWSDVIATFYNAK